MIVKVPVPTETSGPPGEKFETYIYYQNSQGLAGYKELHEKVRSLSRLGPFYMDR